MYGIDSDWPSPVLASQKVCKRHADGTCRAFTESLTKSIDGVMPITGPGYALAIKHPLSLIKALLSCYIFLMQELLSLYFRTAIKAKS